MTAMPPPPRTNSTRRRQVNDVEWNVLTDADAWKVGRNVRVVCACYLRRRLRTSRTDRYISISNGPTVSREDFILLAL